MELNNFCQSCSMPLDNAHGTEKDGSPSKEYCKYCYQDGAFVNPGMTMNEMAVIVKTEMEKRNIDASIISLAVNTLPHLKRWQVQS